MEYEAIIILKEVKNVNKNIDKLISDIKEVVKIGNMQDEGAKNLPYALKHYNVGHWLMFRFESAEENAQKVSEIMQNNKNILKFIVALVENKKFIKIAYKGGLIHGLESNF